jgi:hypothetical protein
VLVDMPGARSVSGRELIRLDESKGAGERSAWGLQSIDRMPSTKQLAWVGLALTLFGCVRIPFVRKHRDKPLPPEAVRRFSDQAQALTQAPGAPGLPEVTRSMSFAIEALPDVVGGDQLAKEVRQQAKVMQQNPTDAPVRASLDAALEAVKRAKPDVSKPSRDQAVEVARQAIQNVDSGQPATVGIAYRDVARAMVVVTGGRPRVPTGNELSRLVARLAVDEPSDARRTGAQAIAALADALEQLPLKPKHAGRTAHELRKRAGQLAAASALDYAGQLKDALSLAVGALDRADAPPAVQRLLDEAQVAVDAIRPDRPLELQRPQAQEALRLVADAITVSVNRP